MAVSKIILNGDVLMDVTQDTVTEGTLLSGQTATGADGVRLTGSAVIPSPASTAPAMDGTAAVGTSVKYAREDHVHPSDTSRQAALVSGTNIKTINGTSLLGSGDITTPTYTLPAATTSTLGGVKVDGTTITATDGVISAVGGGGGGGGFLMTFTENDDTYTADKTFSEIAEALESGIQPTVKFIDGNNHANYVSITSFDFSSNIYHLKLSAYWTATISGSPNAYPSYTSDN